MHSPTERNVVVKRVIALEGDIIRYRIDVTQSPEVDKHHEQE